MNTKMGPSYACLFMGWTISSTKFGSSTLSRSFFFPDAPLTLNQRLSDLINFNDYGSTRYKKNMADNNDETTEVNAETEEDITETAEDNAEEDAENDTETAEDIAEVAEDNAEAAENELLEDNEEGDNDAQDTDEVLEQGAEEEAEQMDTSQVEEGDETAEQSQEEVVLDESAAEADTTLNEETKAESEEEDHVKPDNNEMPQVNVAVLAKRKWQIKVYPLRPEDFMSGQISRVFKNARESLLYIISSGKYSGGKGEMYVSSPIQAAKVVQNIMRLDFKSQFINIEIIHKNDEGVIEERALLKFEAKLVQMLNVPQNNNFKRMGNKRDRERIIGSVFVRNLPKGTSREILRVMFPFAAEINYNPEKFQDGTARLVFGNRNSVGPCLKAFTKAQLGDTQLDLRPIQRKADDKADSAKGTAQAASDKDKDGAGQANKESEGKKSEQGTPSKDANKSSDKPADTKKVGEKGSKPVNVTKKNIAQRGGASRGRFTQDSWDSQNFRGRYRGGPSLRLKSDRGGRYMRGGSYGIRGRTDRRIRPGFSDPAAEMNTEAAKEMMVLQSQLSVAIKNQLSMLNQTQFALEQAKREAATYHSPRDVLPSSSSGFQNRRQSDIRSSNTVRRGQPKASVRRQPASRGGRGTRDQRQEGTRDDYGYKRSADTAGLHDYGTASSYAKRRTATLSGHGDRWADDRLAQSYVHSQASSLAYDYERELDREAEYRSLQGGLSSSSLGGYGHSSGYGYRY